MAGVQTSGIFTGVSAAFAPGSHNLKSTFTSNGGQADFIIGKQTTHLVISPNQAGSLKADQARKAKIFVVSTDWISDSINQKQKLPEDQYILSSSEPAKVMFSYETDFIPEDVLAANRAKEKDLEEQKRRLQERVTSGESTQRAQPRAEPLGPVLKVSALPVRPADFPSQFALVYYRVLQCTDAKENHNKFYALEFHKATQNGAELFRLYSHYGRTDDLKTNPNAGRRECRYYPLETQAEDGFAALIKQKAKKGYAVVDLLASNIGSDALKNFGHSLGDSPQSHNETPSTLDQKIQDLVAFLYNEASAALSKSIGPVKITSRGIETPLGVVTLQQIEKAETILQSFYKALNSGDSSKQKEKIQSLSNAFFAAIPHNMGGRSAASIQSLVLRTTEDLVEKSDLLQLMRDILMAALASKTLSLSEIDMKYTALRNQITVLPPDQPIFKQIHDYVINSQVGPNCVEIENIFQIERQPEIASFHSHLHNIRLLFHGSNSSNFVGLLSRGVLMPKLLVSLGGKRRDAGLLGHGIYFGDSITTSAQYCNTSSRGTSFALLCNVALGSIKEYTKVQFGLVEPPSGYHSVQGVAAGSSTDSEFKDNEFVIFDTSSQHQSYLIEFTKLPVPHTEQLPTPVELPNQTDVVSFDTPPLDQEVSNLSLSDSWTSPTPNPKLTQLNTSRGLTKANIVSLRKMFGPFAFTKAVQMIGPENWRIKRNEDQIRKAFATNPTDFRYLTEDTPITYVTSLNDPYVQLINVFKNTSHFEMLPETPEEILIPKLLSKMRLPGASGSSIVQDKEQFQNHLNAMTLGVLSGLCWDNVFMAGGSVLGALMNISDEQRKKSFCDSDIDLFIYGLTEEKATKKLEDIFFTIQSNTNATGELVRTKHAVTILGQYPTRHVQVVLRIYKSPAEILMGFDIDSCCVGYDGENAWALQRSVRALTKRYNLVDMSRRSLSYESRLYKYAKRGFAVAAPGFIRHQVDPAVYTQRPWQVKGLAKLLLFEHALTNPDGRYDAWRPKGFRLQVYKRDDQSEDRIHSFEQLEQDAADHSSHCDYSNLYFPWGPQWSTQQIVKDLVYRDKAQWSQTRQHVCFIGIDAVLSGVPHWVNPLKWLSSLPEDSQEFHPKFISGPISWVTSNPGTQLLTGSFHPIDDENWYEQTYLAASSIEDFTQTVCDTAFSGHFPALQMVLRKNRLVPVTTLDCYVKRQALAHALVYGDKQCVLEILDKWDDFDTADEQSGFKPIHFAAYCGSLDLVEALIRKGAQTTCTTTSQQWTPLHIASYYGHTEIIKFFLDQSHSVEGLDSVDKHGRNALHLAAMAGHDEIVELLLEKGLDSSIKSSEGISALKAACLRGHVKTAVLIARHCRQDILSLHIYQSPQPQKPEIKDKTFPLLHAVASEDISAVEALLAGDNDEILTEKDSSRVNALHITAFRGNSAIAHILLKKNPCLLNSRDSFGQTPLHYAVRSCSHAVVQELLKFNSNFPIEVNAEDQLGQTPMFYASTLLSTFRHAPNIDSLDGLLLIHERSSLKRIIEILAGAKALPSHLNFFSTLCPTPPSIYLESAPTLQLSIFTQQKSVVIATNIEEQEKQDTKQAEALRFELLMKPKRGKESPIKQNPQKTLAPEKTTFTSTASQLSKLDENASPTQKTPEISTFVQTPNFRVVDGTLPFSKISPKTNPTPSAPLTDWNQTPKSATNFTLQAPITKPTSTKYIGRLEIQAASYKNKSNTPPQSIVGRSLLHISTFFQNGQIHMSQRNALKTLALKNDQGLQAATLIYELNQDAQEFLDTLHKLSHLAHA